MKDKMVWVEEDVNTGHAIRIFKSQKLAFACPGRIMLWLRSKAVKDIRHQIALRANGRDELSGEIITESSMHMHEEKHRGQGGEISLANSVGISYPTHKRAHKDRNPHWRKP